MRIIDHFDGTLKSNLPDLEKEISDIKYDSMNQLIIYASRSGELSIVKEIAANSPKAMLTEQEEEEKNKIFQQKYSKMSIA